MYVPSLWLGCRLFATEVFICAVIYTVNFTATMPNEVNYTIQYKVTGDAAFTYIENSMQPL